MKVLIGNLRWSKAIRLSLVLLALASITGIAFWLGIGYANRRAAVRAASDGCFSALIGLGSLDKPVKWELAPVLDLEMDFCGAALAEMSLNHPGLIEWSHYNLLVKVREYRKRNGRLNPACPERNPEEVDRKIAQAIAYLESIHPTNDWFPPTSQSHDLIRSVP